MDDTTETSALSENPRRPRSQDRAFRDSLACSLEHPHLIGGGLETYAQAVLNSVAWWREQYAIHANGGEAHKLALPYIERFPTLAAAAGSSCPARVECEHCGRLLGQTAKGKNSRHRCLNGRVR